MDFLINKQETKKFIRRALTESKEKPGEYEVETLPVKDDFYRCVETYTLLDENLKPVFKEVKEWSFEKDGYVKVKRPVIFSQNQINTLKAQNTPCNLYDEKTIENHPTRIIAKQKEEIEKLKKKGLFN